MGHDVLATYLMVVARCEHKAREAVEAKHDVVEGCACRQSAEIAGVDRMDKENPGDSEDRRHDARDEFRLPKLIRHRLDEHENGEVATAALVLIIYAVQICTQVAQHVLPYAVCPTMYRTC